VVDITRSLGLDVGDVRVGVALGDPLGILASPFTIVTRRGDASDYTDILKIIDDHAVELIVVGLPISMDGSEGVQAVKTRAFVEELKNRTSVPVVFQDERLSTVEARRMVREARKPARTERYDAAAAALILQDYLNAASPALLPDEDEDAGRP
jgi:putative Holliday junction resolvase